MRLLAVGLVMVAMGCAADIVLPGEPAERAPVGYAPFPDRLSAYVWRNWFCVPKERLAEVVGATAEQITGVARELGLPPQPELPPEWAKKGYITVLRRNWHLLPYEQLMALVGMDRKAFRFALAEDDFLFGKMGSVKPLCEPLRYAEGEGISAVRRRLADLLREEGVDPVAPEEPRFAFIAPFKNPDAAIPPSEKESPPFDRRLIFSYCAEYGDPLMDPEIASYPDGLLQRLAHTGVNAVWLHTVLRTLAKDPAFPEFGEGSEVRIANLRKLVARAGQYGIRVYLYMNEPRAMPPAFFTGREGMLGVPEGAVRAFCTSSPEVLRWLSDAMESVFTQVPGLGGILTITASENLTSCASHGGQAWCPRCKNRPAGEIIAEVNTALIAGMARGNPDAEALVWDWGWPDDQVATVMARLPKKQVRFMSVSEWGLPITRGGIASTVGEYSLSAVGPSQRTVARWDAAHAAGLKTMAKVQTGATWEFCVIPYLPVMDLVAEHALNLSRSGADGVMLSWSLGCYPSPNLKLFQTVRRGDTGIDGMLDRVAESEYGKEAVPALRRAWTLFSDGFREYPFHIGTIYNGPQHMGPANPLYFEPTGYQATMVGIPYDDLDRWRSIYPAEIWIGQMEKVRQGFARGCEAYRKVIETCAEANRAKAEREWGTYRAAELHFTSCVAQGRFILARERFRTATDDAGREAARAEMARLAREELATAKELLPLVRADSRIGYECSNHYFYIPQDLREKILCCRAVLERLGAPRYGCRPVAHRGGSAEFEENTLAAFEGCLKAGIRAFETDIRISRDGALFLMHDDSVSRTMKGEGTIETLSADAIGRLRSKRGNEPVPTLDAFLEKMAPVPGVYLQLELKSAPAACPGGDAEAYCRAIRDRVAAHPLAEGGQCVYSSFNLDLLRAMRKVNPDVPLIVLTSACTEREIALAKALGGPVAISCKTGNASRSQILNARAAGIRVGGWAAGTLTRYRLADALGCDFVTTDVPVEVMKSGVRF